MAINQELTHESRSLIESSACEKKAGVVQHLKMLHHAGLLFNRPPG
jgi:hypothetical protein